MACLSGRLQRCSSGRYCSPLLLLAVSGSADVCLQVKPQEEEEQQGIHDIATEYHVRVATCTALNEGNKRPGRRTPQVPKIHAPVVGAAKHTSSELHNLQYCDSLLPLEWWRHIQS